MPELTPTTVIQFAKAPVLGKVKTRLASVLDADQRNQLHCALTSWTFHQLSRLSAIRQELWVDGEGNQGFFRQLTQGNNCEIHLQPDGNLGTKMHYALSRALQDSHFAIIVGSDCPFITPAYVNQAISALANYDVVVGPADDGGYVLLGLKEAFIELFDNISWGSEKVLSESVRVLENAHCSFRLLPSLSDIDRPRDLLYLDQAPFPQQLRDFAHYRV